MKKLSAFLVTIICLSFIPASFNVVLAADTVTPFSDVPTGGLNTDAITYLKGTGVISGYPDGSYKPSGEINRAEFTKIVVGSLYTDVKGKNCFPDVKTQWFAPYVCKAKSLGIIEGNPDGTFKPSESIKFSEAAKIITNAYKLNPGASGTEWFKPYVTALEAKKDIPLSVDYFDQNVKRDEMAEMIYRLKANVTNKATRSFAEITGEGFVQGNSCADLKERFVEQSLYQNNASGVDRVMLEEQTKSGSLPFVPTSAAPTAAGTASQNSSTGHAVMDNSGASSSYSTTNVQVSGVDEADVIKNDGRYIYLIKGNAVRIVDAYPADNLKEIISFTLGDDKTESYSPSEMYVNGNQLTVIGNSTRMIATPVTSGTSTSSKIIVPPYFGQSRTKVYVIDITDRSQPKVSRSVEYDGYYSSSRRIGDTLYIVLNRNIYFPYYYYDATTKAAMQQEAVDAIVPKMVDSKNGTEKLIVPCGDIRIMPKPRNFSYVIASAIPLDDKTKDVSSTVIVGNSDNLYASTGNLYVAATNWVGGYFRADGGSDTMVYKFSLKDQKVAFEAAGRVAGTILNQFSMDEYLSNFRIATSMSTYNPVTNEVKLSNAVYVLNGAMDTIGKVENIAPGEKLYSSRFTGKTGYLVTFKTVDPLFVLDLSNARDPKIKGTLKVPGYSSYLEPYDETHLIGFGNDVDENDPHNTKDFVYYTAIKGVKVSLFDVSNLAHPVEMFKEIIGDRGTYSDVLNNHKALLFDKAKGLLAFPVTVYEQPTGDVCKNSTYSSCPSTCQKICVPSSCTDQGGIKVCTADCDGANSCMSYDANNTKPVFDGAYVYNLNLTDGFKLKGKVTHYDDADTLALSTNGYTNYDKTIQRIIYIGEYLYTISQGAIKANYLSDMVEKKIIELAGATWNVF
jgi:inhibitor of cysteine peptidase